MDEEIIEEIEEITQEEIKEETDLLTSEEKEPEDDSTLDTDDFIRELAERAGFTMSDTKIFLRTMQEVFEDAIAQSISIKIRGFLSLHVQNIDSFTGINAYKTRISGEKVIETFPPSKRVVIKAALNLRDLVRKPSKRKIQNSNATRKAISEYEDIERR
jgi:nucleoid DNA-binding protein